MFLSVEAVLKVIFTCLLLWTSSHTVVFSHSAIEKVPNVQYLSLNGTWRFLPDHFQPANQYSLQLDDSYWSNIHVPSNWYLQGFDIHGSAWYRYRFSVPKSFANKILRLNFDAVDYTADVWLNGQYLGFHEGMFAPFSFTVTDTVKLGEENILAVKVNSPSEANNGAWSLHKRLIKGIFSHHDTRPGGAWSLRGQEKNTGGIWGGVYLKATKQLSIDRIQIKSKINLNNNHVRAAVSLKINNHSKKLQTYATTVTLTPQNFKGPSKKILYKNIKLKPGSQLVNMAVEQPDAKLWWPHEQGFPHLYTIAVSIYKNSVLLDSVTKTTGFRVVSYDTETGQWQINGRRVFLRGTNYISSQWLSEMDTQRYAFDVALMQRAHINVVRVHAHLEAAEFYQQCDEAGLLVWQDFPLQWGYTDDPTFTKVAQRQVKEMIQWLNPHPAIIAWSLHNEPPWDAKWMKYKYTNYDPNQNRILDETLYDTARKLDHSRYVHMHSATGEHPWLGWYSGHWKDYAKPTQKKLISEYGAQALPILENLSKIIPQDQLWPDQPEDWELWEYHNFQRRETFDIAKVQQGKNIHEFVANTQHYQARLTQYAAEAYRRQKYNPVGSIFQFMFVENWPSINWGILDYWRDPKPAYYALQRAYQPVLPSIQWQTDRFTHKQAIALKFWIINDLHKTYPNANLHYILQHNDAVIEQTSQEYDIAKDSVVKVSEWQNKVLPAGNYTLLLRLNDQYGKLLGHNQFKFKVMMP